MTIKPGLIGLLSMLLFGAMGASGCASDSYAAKGAGKGAGTGALAGAVGGAATALIFGGNVGEAAARGAVYGGASGAVVGGLSGAEADRRVAEQKRAEYERRVAEFREEIGTDAFNGFVALAECKSKRSSPPIGATATGLKHYCRRSPSGTRSSPPPRPRRHALAKRSTNWVRSAASTICRRAATRPCRYSRSP